MELGESKFELGTTLVTGGVSQIMESNPVFAKEVYECLSRYAQGDWGVVDPEDAKMNDAALDPEEPDRILAAYNTSAGKIWIITEWDRSATTVLFPNEY